MPVFGQYMQNAMKIAVQDINREFAAAGSNIQFQMIGADTVVTPEGALKAIQSLHETNGVNAFVGPANSNELGGILSYALSNKLNVVCMSSSDAYSIPKPGIYRPYVTNHLTGPPVARLMWANGVKDVACLYRDDAFGSSLNTATQTEFEALGGTWHPAKYTVDQPDYASEVAALSSTVSGLGVKPTTAVFHVTFETDGLNIYQHAASDAVLPNVNWYGTTDSKRDAFLPPLAPQAIGDFLVKVNSSGLFPVNPLSPVNNQFVSEFKALTGVSPDGFDPYFYDDTWLMCLGLAETAALSSSVQYSDKLWNTVRDIANRYTGASGATPLDANGDLAQADFGVWHAAKDSTGKYSFPFIKYYSAMTGSFSDWIPSAFFSG
jgi:ABC-type branched-subunit amino acid transport system substrate-binding protein